jgi:hypothetical protein
MRIQLDSVLKIIKVEETVNFGELIKYLEKLLPKDSTIGYWKDFKLETNTIIYNWNYPVYINNPIPLQPIYPTWTINPLPYKQNEITCTDIKIASTPNGIYNLEFN